MSLTLSAVGADELPRGSSSLSAPCASVASRSDISDTCERVTMAYRRDTSPRGTEVRYGLAWSRKSVSSSSLKGTAMFASSARLRQRKVDLSSSSFEVYSR